MNNGLSMIFVTALVTLASTAIANQLWQERDGDAGRLHFSEPVGNLRERSGALLKGITSPYVFATGTSAAPRRRDDHLAWTAP